MIQTIARRYLPTLDDAMRKLAVKHLPKDAGLDLMGRYALGWVDENDTPYDAATGKRLRPMLLLLCTEAASGTWETALPAAAAIEFVHNFSLIHDDIEDNSPMRHGRSSVWQVWGIPKATNAGDAIFALSYAALAELELSDSQLVKIWRIFNFTMMELTRGQHLDMSFEDQAQVSIDAYLSMIRGKSATLLAAAAQIGALIADVDEQTASHYYDFALNLGVAFQIHDDILGIWGDPSVTGKSAATDILSRKKSLPVLYGLENSAELTALYAQETFGEEDVTKTVALLDELAAQDYAREQEKHFYDLAVEALKQAKPSGEAATFLDGFMAFLFEREY